LTESGTNGEVLAFGELCYFKSDGKWWRTDANSIATTEGILGVCVFGGSTDATGMFLTYGYCRDDSWNWTAKGVPLWVGTSPGAMVETAGQPSGSGDQIRKFGFARTADILYLFQDTTIIELP